MSNFSPKLEDSTDEQLKFSINEHNPHYASLSSDELSRRGTEKLRKTITSFNNQSSSQTKELIRLTKWITALTAVMVVGLLVQIYLALK